MTNHKGSAFLLMGRIILIAVVSIGINRQIFAQVTRPDSAGTRSAFNRAAALYEHSSGEQSGIFNGSQYIMDRRSFGGEHLFFESPTWISGSIVYDGMQYPDVTLVYDLVNNEVVTQHFGAVYLISLIKDKISSFSILGHTFIRAGYTDPDSVLRRDFYERIYNGRLTLLVKHRKEVISQVTPQGVVNKVEYTRRYYLGKGGTYYALKNGAALLNILGDQKKEIKEYIKANSINYKKDNADGMVRIAEYYDRRK